MDGKIDECPACNRAKDTQQNLSPDCCNNRPQSPIRATTGLHTLSDFQQLAQQGILARTGQARRDRY